MKKLAFITTIILSATLVACTETITEMANHGQELVLSYPETNQFNLASSGPDFWDDALIKSDLSLETDTLTFSVHLHTPEPQPVKVNIEIDPTVTAPFQDPVADSIQYALMPENYYEILLSELEIPAGITDTSFQVVIFPKQFDISQTGYVLPVSISTPSAVNLSSMHTAYIHIAKDPFPPYSTNDWTVVNFSSQEETGEGSDNGRVYNAFDGNSSTFWHTQWDGAQPGPPHWFVIDMHQQHVLHGIMFLDRQGVGSPGRPKEVKVEASLDNSTWEIVKTFTLPDNNTWQNIKFTPPTTSYRYLKVTISSMYGDTFYTNLAEFKVY